MSKQLVKRGDNLTFVTITLPALRALSYNTNLSIEIKRDGVIAKKAGAQQITVELNSEGSRLTTTLSQSDVNHFHKPSKCQNPFQDIYSTSINTAFTSDKTDDEIREQAKAWCKSTIDMYQKEIEQMNSNLFELSEKLHNT